MVHKKIAALFLALGLMQGCTPSSVEVVPLVRVICDPSQFHGKEIIVRGFLKVKHEDIAIYLSKDVAVAGLTENSLWVSESSEIKLHSKEGASSGELKLKDFDSSYVMIRGKFDYHSRGHMSGHSGTILVDELFTVE
ncbi:hypothetical protein [Microbulbifer taiwanensis]|nr:hypothetical protein [Microbulbifer taiwanensis]